MATLKKQLGSKAVPLLSAKGGIRGFFQEYVPDDTSSDSTDSMKVFKGIVVMRLMKSDSLPAFVGSSRQITIGSLGAAYNKEILDRFGITYILTVGYNIRPKFPNDFKYQFIEVRDAPTENLSSHFDAACEFIDQALSSSPNGKVLVHCFMGRSRSATILCAYLMKMRKLRYHEALAVVRENRPQAQPNMGFVAQLLKLEETLFGSIEGATPPTTSQERKRTSSGEGWAGGPVRPTAIRPSSANNNNKNLPTK